MKLDESIELMNKNENLNKMENMSNQHMRSMMEQMALDEAMKDCMYEVLTMEGFLPETLSEGESYEGVMSAMMEDDDIMAEMYKACSMNESDCGMKMESWLQEKLVGGQKELDKNDNGKIDAGDFEALRKEKGVDEMEMNEYDKEVMSRFQNQYGKKRGKQIYYATANKQERSPETFEKNEGEMYEGDYPEGEHYKVKVSQICDDLADVNRMMDGNAELPAWIQDKIAVMYHSADAIKSYLQGETSPAMNEAEEDDDDAESPTYLLNKKRVLDQEISRYSGYVAKFIPLVDKLDAADITAYFQPQSEFSVEGFKDFLTKKEDESSVDYYEKLNQTGEWTYRSIFDSLVNPRKRGFFMKYGNKLGMDTTETMEDILSDVFDMGNSIYAKKKEIEKIEDAIGDRGQKGDGEMGDDEMGAKPTIASKAELDVLSADDLGMDDDMLEEASLPVKGNNVDSQNKSNSEKENGEATKDAEDSQETTEEKVDNLKNQKHTKNSWEENVDQTMHGWRNNLDLDYRTGLDKDQVERIKDQASGLAPEDHANVDHESEAGKKLMDAAKTRSDDEFINGDDYTSSHDRTSIERGQTYVKTTVFNNGKVNESEEAPINEDIERLKSLFKYEEKLISENKDKGLNENEVFFKQVSTKKFI
jgi:hypothetical protein